MKKVFLLLAVAGMFAACNMPMKNDNSAANKAKVMRFYDEVFNAHNTALLDSFVTADFVDHTPDPGHTGKGMDDLKSGFHDFFTAFPDIHVTPEILLASGDTIASKVQITGTNTGPGAMGPNFPATNKKVDVNMIEILIIKDGKATDRWGYFDQMKWMEQLGLGGPGAGAPMDTTKKKVQGI